MEDITFIVIFWLIVIIIILLARKKGYTSAGKKGENLIYDIISDIFLPKHILRNVYLKRTKEKYTEIDLLAVNNKGIFVFESKFYGGWIYGSEDRETWTQTFGSEKKSYFYSPIYQNRTHIEAVKEKLNNDHRLKYFSIIVFGNACTIKSMDIKSPDIYVIKREQLKSTINSILENNAPVITDTDVENICVILSEGTTVDDSIKEKHIQDIENYLNNKK